MRKARKGATGEQAGVSKRRKRGFMIYLTGDTHGDFSRVFAFCERMHTTKEDILIVLGDAGLNYYLNDRDKARKKELEAAPITLLCIHGNHEQRPYAIGTYEERKWHGGTVYVENDFPSILFAKDGEIYDFNGRKAIAIGGAYSVDKFYRVARYIPWYDNEQPSSEIKQYVEQQLDAVDWKVDYVLSHTAPLKYEPVEVFLVGINQSLVDKSTEEWLDRIENKLEYGKWFCGHYHTKKKIDRLQLMFEDYCEMENA